MVESVILNHPVLLLIFGAALGLFLFDKQYRNTRGWFTLGSAVLCAAGAAYALILGAGTGEVLVVLLVFLCLNLEGWR